MSPVTLLEWEWEEGPSATAQHHIKIAWFIVSFEAPLGPESEPEHEPGKGWTGP